MWFEVAEALATSFWMVIGITIILGLFVVFSIAISFLYRAYDRTKDKARGYSSLKTVTFGDESSVVANRVASIAAVLSVFLIWCIATGSSLIPTILPPPFTATHSSNTLRAMLLAKKHQQQSLFVFTKPPTKSLKS